MHLQNKLFILLGCCSVLSACGPQQYYMPITNQAGNTQSLSKTTDTVRVVMPYKFPELVNKTREQGKDWLVWSKSA